MLEITNLRDGEVLNHHHGIETEDYLKVTTELLQSVVTVSFLQKSNLQPKSIRLRQKQVIISG